MADKLSFLTVTYQHDFPLLVRQLQSIEKFVHSEYTHHIVLNDDIQHMSELVDLTDGYKNVIITHRDRVPGFVAHPTPLYGNIDYGWFMQQTCKLVAANIVTTDYYLVLDSKNYLVDSFDVDQWIGDKVSALRFYPDVDLTEWFKETCRLFELDYSKCVDRAMEARTPFVMRTQHVLDLLEYIHSRGLTITEVIGNHEHAKFKSVEFYLYNGWLLYTGRLDQEIHWIDYANEFRGSKEL